MLFNFVSLFRFSFSFLSLCSFGFDFDFVLFFVTGLTFRGFLSSS